MQIIPCYSFISSWRRLPLLKKTKKYPLTYNTMRYIISCIRGYKERRESMDVQLKRGMLDICVLSVLLREDSYGYKIIKDLQPYVTISESTLYPILRRLETAACVTVYSTEHNGRLRKYYQITENGRAKISEFLEEWQGMMDIYKFIKKEMTENE